MRSDRSARRRVCASALPTGRPPARPSPAGGRRIRPCGRPRPGHRWRGLARCAARSHSPASACSRPASSSASEISSASARRARTASVRLRRSCSIRLQIKPCEIPAARATSDCARPKDSRRSRVGVPKQRRRKGVGSDVYNDATARESLLRKLLSRRQIYKSARNLQRQPVTPGQIGEELPRRGRNGRRAWPATPIASARS